MIAKINSSKFNKKKIKLPTVFGALALLFSTVLSGCISSSSADDEAFKEEYAVAQKKYEKYINGPVSGQEVLELVENWSESDYDLIVESSKGHICTVKCLDKNDTIDKYRNKETIYYIDPNALYEGTFMLFADFVRGEYRGSDIDSLKLSLVKDSPSSDDSPTDQND